MKTVHKIAALAGLAAMASIAESTRVDVKRKYPSGGGFSGNRKLKSSVAKRRKQAKRNENRARNRKH